MGALLPLPKLGDVFTDIRGDDRTLRVSRHDDSGVVVVSVWADRNCRASFRLAADEVPRLIAALGAGLDVTAPVADTATPAETTPAAPDGPTSGTTASRSAAGLSLLGDAADVPGPRIGVSRWWDWARRRAS